MRHHESDQTGLDELFRDIDLYRQNPKAFPPSFAGTTAHTADLFIKGEIDIGFLRINEERIENLLQQEEQVCRLLKYLPPPDNKYKQYGLKLQRVSRPSSLYASYTTSNLDKTPLLLQALAKHSKKPFIEVILNQHASQSRILEDIENEIGIKPKLGLRINLTTDPRIIKCSPSLKNEEREMITTTFFSIPKETIFGNTTPSFLMAMTTVPKKLGYPGIFQELFWQKDVNRYHYQTPLNPETVSLFEGAIKIMQEAGSYFRDNLPR